jgi:hypothetical protein
MVELTLVLVGALLLNIPCGMRRAGERKFSWQWFLWVHMPIPLIVAARIFWHVDIAFIPLIILAALVGQYIGGWFGNR